MQFTSTIIAALLATVAIAAPTTTTLEARDCTCSQADYHSRFGYCMFPHLSPWTPVKTADEQACANSVAAVCGDCGAQYKQ